MTRNVLRTSDEKVSKENEIDPYLLYNGSIEEYEDAADYARINVIKAVKLA